MTTLLPSSVLDAVESSRDAKAAQVAGASAAATPAAAVAAAAAPPLTWQARFCRLRGRFLFIHKGERDPLDHPVYVVDLEECQVVAIEEEQDAPVADEAHDADDAGDAGDAAGSDTPPVGLIGVYNAATCKEELRLRTKSIGERDAWIETLLAGASGPSRRVLLEYRGHEICDEEDAEQIERATAEIAMFVRGERDEAAREVSRVRQDAQTCAAKSAELRQHQKVLAREIKTLRLEVAEQQEAYDVAERELERHRETWAKQIKQQKEVVARARELREALRATDVERLSSQHTDDSQQELLGRSLGMLEELRAKIKEFSLGESVTELRLMFAKMLESQLEVRIRNCGYAENVLVLTEEKLDRFESAGGSSSSGSGLV